ncbi:hypothetical protein PF005_g15298 [Phytophthora fragariae]|uniref:RxLR effector protein n=1 Tax=Phytophthora fragariae TaxID=53985 RepID=A0A6A3E9S9_9STRA|nr:hypothetical protein PF003_g37349 [Phytophthora fragariae]KAE8928651.1 hypothetical protein PF009_g21213 [Phytophthora fragariae]KAE8988725.1 hypothetical protein PF011_g19056 [Phytophthora fragariae]KAE9087078.1 hypothetical protein PF010_g19858 [Phytophthora fragariae]KAE9100140.1 hypothetical protein PF007_g15628 [Phytophthora fragariae]
MRVYLLAAAILFASCSAATEVEQTEASKLIVPETSAWGRALSNDEGVTKRFLRTEKTTTEENEDEEDADEEERVLPGTDAAKKLIPKLEKAASSKQLIRQEEEKQFALWFITGRGPSYVAENILKINPLSSTQKGVAVYRRYLEWFKKYKNIIGLRFHTTAK